MATISDMLRYLYVNHGPVRVGKVSIQPQRVTGVDVGKVSIRRPPGVDIGRVRIQDDPEMTVGDIEIMDDEERKKYMAETMARETMRNRKRKL